MSHWIWLLPFLRSLVSRDVNSLSNRSLLPLPDRLTDDRQTSQAEIFPSGHFCQEQSEEVLSFTEAHWLVGPAPRSPSLKALPVGLRALCLSLLSHLQTEGEAHHEVPFPGSSQLSWEPSPTPIPRGVCNLRRGGAMDQPDTLLTPKPALQVQAAPAAKGPLLGPE